MKPAPTPRTLRTVAVATIVAIALAGCGSSDSTSDTKSSSPAPTEAPADTAATADTAAPTTEATGDAPTADALTVESGFSTGLSSLSTRYTSAGAMVTNTAALAACGVKVQFEILDAAGTVLDTQTEKVRLIGAGVAVSVVPNPMGGGRPEEPTQLDVTVLEVASFQSGATCDDAAATPAVSLSTSDVTIDDDLRYIRGQVTNSTDASVEHIAIDCVLRGADGAIVGGDKTAILEPTAAGSAVAFKVRMLWAPPTAATADCSAVA